MNYTNETYVKQYILFKRKLFINVEEITLFLFKATNELVSLQHFSGHFAHILSDVHGLTFAKIAEPRLTTDNVHIYTELKGVLKKRPVLLDLL